MSKGWNQDGNLLYFQLFVSTKENNILRDKDGKTAVTLTVCVKMKILEHMTVQKCKSIFLHLACL